MKLYLLLSISFIALQAISSKTESPSDPLYYYNKYEQRRIPKTTSTPTSPKPKKPISRQQQFEHEHKLKQEHWNLSKQINETKHKNDIQAHKLVHEESNLLHQRNTITAELMATNQMNADKIKAIKSDINNTEKYRELFMKRYQKNSKELKVGSKDAKLALKKLVDFDDQRITMYTTEESNDQKAYERISHENIAKSKDLMDVIHNLQTKIHEVKENIRKDYKQTRLRVENLEKKDAKIIDMIKDNDKVQGGNTQVKDNNKNLNHHNGLSQFRRGIEFFNQQTNRENSKLGERNKETGQVRRKMVESLHGGDSDGEDVISIETLTPVCFK